MPGGHKVLVVQVMGRIFMDPLDDPFAAVDGEMQKYRLGSGSVDAVIVDIHGEATSEKMALGHFCDGRASPVCGTHSHGLPAEERRRVGRGRGVAGRVERGGRRVSKKQKKKK